MARGNLSTLRKVVIPLGFVVMGFATLSTPVAAQHFPSRSIRLILPYNPGGIVDFAGRVLAKELTASLGETVIAENKAGAGGIVGVNEVAHDAPDGYNLVLIDPSIVINQTLHKSMPYDVFKDLVTISIVCSSPHVLVVSPQLGITTYAQLVAYGKANPGKLNFGSAGVGTTPHLAGLLWTQRTRITATHVPYKGVGPSFVDLMSGKIQMEFSSIAGALPFTSKGSVVPLATTGLKRSPVYPDLPTVAEEGLPGFDVEVWLGLYGSAGMPKDVLNKLNDAVGRALQEDEVKTAFGKFSIEPRGTSLADGAAFTRAEYEKWKNVIVDGHITLD
ncbi:MAG TPA: tripartite tricarboxylate transporter substrate binding protein [Xanthobacteraceae bacterium]